MKSRVSLGISALAVVLSFVLGYSLGQADDSAGLQGNLSEVVGPEVALEEAASDKEFPEGSLGDLEVVSAELEWNSQTHGLEVVFEVTNTGEADDTAAIAVEKFSVSTHLKMKDGDKNVNFIDTVEGEDTRLIPAGDSVFVKAYMPGGEELSALAEEGFDVRKFEVSVDTEDAVAEWNEFNNSWSY